MRFAVVRSIGPAWDKNRSLEKQPGWRPHIVIGGTLAGTEDLTLAPQVPKRSGGGPWGEDMLKVVRIAP
ncbi:MAG TPA: hypothetical protein VHT03_10240 [Rhizomicrobium sp.]|jgi:hypothetical protein|nr:hypothetical protein [Rhizomicrobium sp.]